MILTTDLIERDKSTDKNNFWTENSSQMHVTLVVVVARSITNGYPLVLFRGNIRD